MELLKDLNPQTIAIVGALWLLREVLGFAKNFVKQITEMRRSDTTTNEDHFSRAEAVQILGALKAVADHITAQTKLMEGFVYEMRSFKDQLTRVEGDVEDLKNRRSSP